MASKSADPSPRLTVQSLIEDAWYGSIHVNASKALSFYRKSSAISTAVDLIASKIETIRPVIERDGEILDRDEITDFLAKPNDDAMWRHFIGNAARNFLLTGNTFFQGLGTLNRPALELYSSSPISAKDLDVKEMGVTNKDMDFVNLDEVTKGAIFSRYNIPLPLITSTRQTLCHQLPDRHRQRHYRRCRGVARHSPG